DQRAEDGRLRRHDVYVLREQRRHAGQARQRRDDHERGGPCDEHHVVQRAWAAAHDHRRERHDDHAHLRCAPAAEDAQRGRRGDELRLRQRRSAHEGYVAGGSYLTYTYDAAHRLTAMADSLGNSVTYTLDAMDNR